VLIERDRVRVRFDLDHLRAELRGAPAHAQTARPQRPGQSHDGRTPRWASVEVDLRWSSR
jgi:hypothetical protein